MFPLWMAALVIILHLIEPHDHHKNEINHQEQDQCSNPAEESGKTSGVPVHCVILNDITIEKITTEFTHDHQLPSFDLLIEGHNDFFKEDIGCKSSLYTKLSEGITDDGFLLIPNLRAPPFIA